MNKILYKSGDFEGPLDLMLYLVRKNKLNIQNIRISELLEQYMSHIKDMGQNDMEISSEFLEMAAKLVYIKTLSLLPKKEEEEKLKKELCDQIIEYEECKKLAEILNKRANFDSFIRSPEKLNFKKGSYSKKHNISDLFKSYIQSRLNNKVGLKSPDKRFSVIVSKKITSVYSKVMYIFRILRKTNSCSYSGLFISQKDKSSIIATFLAILELVKVKRVFIKKENSGKLNVILNRKRR